MYARVENTEHRRNIVLIFVDFVTTGCTIPRKDNQKYNYKTERYLSFAFLVFSIVLCGCSEVILVVKAFLTKTSVIILYRIVLKDRSAAIIAGRTVRG